MTFVQDNHTDVILSFLKGFHESIEPHCRRIDDDEEFTYWILQLLAAIPYGQIARSAGFRDILA